MPGSIINRLILIELVKVFLMALTGLTGLFLIAGLIQEAAQRDPLLRLATYLVNEGVLAEGERAQMERDIESQAWILPAQIPRNQN